jgi:hypothetical protein
MWLRIMLTPWWARALPWSLVVVGAFAAMACVRWLAGEPFHPGRTIPVAAALAVFVGLVAAAITHRRHTAYVTALEGFASPDRSAVIETSWRGTVPADARVRAAAIRVGAIRLAAAQRSTRLTLRVAVVLALALALDLGSKYLFEPVSHRDLPFLGTMIALTACAAASAWCTARGTQRRLALLRNTAFDNPARGGDGGPSK